MTYCLLSCDSVRKSGCASCDLSSERAVTQRRTVPHLPRPTSSPLRTKIRSPGKARAGSPSVEARGNPLVHFRQPDKRRPVLILTRDEVIDQLNEIIVVPATRTIRGLRSEVVLTQDDGMPTVSALNFDHVALARRDRLGPVLCALPNERWSEVREALLVACGFAHVEAG